MQEDTDNTEDESRSKSQIKREMHDLRDLGEELVKLPADQFEKINLPEELRDAIIEARRIHQHGAHKRQLQYIGRLMRKQDSAPIQEQLDTVKGQSHQAAQALHYIEQWRNRLLGEGDTALEDMVQQYPQVDRQYLRQLIRNATKELHANRPPKSSRALFRYLRDLIDAN